MARVTKDTTIGEVIQIDAGVIPILMGAGMHCVDVLHQQERHQKKLLWYTVLTAICSQKKSRATFSHQANIKKAKGCLILKDIPLQ